METRTRVVVLQHPRERDMPIGTARMATLCLPGAELHEGVRWDDEALRRLLSDPTRPPVLLYPGEGAIDVTRDPPRGPVTLVVVDGTWSQAKKIVRENPRLKALPRYAFTPTSPSQYRIRKEPEETYVSTLEALVHVLGALEGDAGRFEPLLRPFRAMIDTQIACERELHGAGARHAKKATWPKKSRVHPWLSGDGSSVVVVAGEANAWPYCDRKIGAVYEDELVHWVARRLGTGETFARVVAPMHPLAPRTARYVDLDPQDLAAGCTRESLFDAFWGFLRETDVVCFWGHYAPALFVASGGHLPSARLDLRGASRDYARTKVGTIDEHVARLALDVPGPHARGRAAKRLEQVSALVSYFRGVAAAHQP